MARVLQNREGETMFRMIAFSAALAGSPAVSAQEGHATSHKDTESTAEATGSDTSEKRETDDLNLICFGAGSANKADVANAYGNSSGTAVGTGGFATYSGNSNATVISRRSQAFEDQVSVKMNPEEGRLRMPRTMLPSVRGGKDGWFKLKKIKYKEGEITASIAVNIINNPKVRIDRYTGTISISGKAGDYSGKCQKFDPAETERQF